MATSVGPLVAVLGVDGAKWKQGLDSAKRDLENTSKKMAQVDFAAPTARELNRSQKAFQAGFRQSGGSRLDVGQELVGVRQFSRRDFDLAQNQSGGIGGALATNLGSAVALMGAFKLGIDGAVIGAKLLSGEIKDWGQAASDFAKSIPIIGGSISRLIDYGRGADLKAESDARHKAEDRARSEAKARRDVAAEGFRRDVTKAREEARIAGLTGIDRDLASIELARQEREQAIRDRFSQTPGLSGRERDDLIDASNQKAAQERDQALRNYAKEQARERTEMRNSLQIIRLQNAGHHQAAEEMKIQAEAARAITEAQEKGNYQLALALQVQRDLSLTELKRQNTSRGEDLRTDIQAARLRANGQSGLADLVQAKRDFDRRIADAQAANDFTAVDDLKELRGVELGARARDLLRGGGSAAEVDLRYVARGNPAGDKQQVTLEQIRDVLGRIEINLNGSDWSYTRN